MPVPTYRAPKDSKPWGLLGYLKDFISPPGYVPRGPFGARVAGAEPLPGAAPTDAQLRAEGYGTGVREYDPLQTGVKPPGYQTFGTPTPIVTGTRDGATPDRTQSDLYKQYALNAPGQFERYFKTQEMDPYFGAASRGAGAPKDVEAMKALAARTTAPGKTPQDLATFYRAESAMGRAQMPEIQESLGYAKGSELAKWAEANPMLAQRLYAKKQAGAKAAKQEIASQPATPSQYGGSVATGAFGAAAPTLGSEDFAVAANAVPAPWNTQGSKVSADFAGVVPFQAAKTTGEGMPAFQTTSEKAEAFLKSPAIAGLFGAK